MHKLQYFDLLRNKLYNITTTREDGGFVVRKIHNLYHKQYTMPLVVDLYDKSVLVVQLILVLRCFFL